MATLARLKVSRSDPASSAGVGGSSPGFSTVDGSLSSLPTETDLMLPPLEMPSSQSEPSTRPSLQFYIVFFVGIACTFMILLMVTPPIMTQTTHDQLEQQVQSQRRLTTKIAFIADAGLNEASNRVLKLIREEGCDMVLHQGDLDYSGKSVEFFKSVDSIFGPTFPYFVTMGNYESKRGAGRDVAWGAYHAIQRARLKRIQGLSCAVVSLRNLACTYEGVSFVTSAIGVNSSRLGLDLRELRAAQVTIWGDANEDIGSAATQFKSTWKFCSWHLPLIDFQVGFREGVPWMASPKLVEAYESCRQRGAVILTGHEHYYVRSHTIRRYSENPKSVKYEEVHVEVSPKTTSTMMVDANSTTSASYSTFPTLAANGEPELVELLKVGPGSSFAVVSGLGGHSVSVPSAHKQREFPHLAAIHPQALITEVDPNGKVFYPEITGTNSETTSNRIESKADEKEGYPFGALICVLQKSAVPRAKGFCYFKTISGKIVDRFLLHRF